MKPKLRSQSASIWMYFSYFPQLVLSSKTQAYLSYQFCRMIKLCEDH